MQEMEKKSKGNSEKFMQEMGKEDSKVKHVGQGCQCHAKEINSVKQRKIKN
jgi:hypothetical protein